MKVLQVGKFYPIVGGVEKVMWDLTRGLSVAGVDCDMLCACLKEDMPEGGKVVFNPHGTVFCIPAWKKVAATMLCPGMIFWLRRHRKEYDIIHVHHPDPMACLALMLSGFRGRVVLHWHSDILKQKFLLRFYGPLQSWLIKRADKVVGTTPVYVRESPFLRNAQDKVTYLPIGVEPVCPDAEKVEALRSKFVGKRIVFSLGRLVGYKGFEYLVDAAAFLPDDYVVAIGGSGPLMDSLKARIADKGLESKVEMLGRVLDSELSAWYGACDVFCLSSIWKTEAFAIVQIEAMSAGKPVVATRIPGSGVSWVNEDGVSGLNVPVCDAGALAGAIMCITASDASYDAFSSGALRRFGDMFTYGKMIENCIGLYNALI